LFKDYELSLGGEGETAETAAGACAMPAGGASTSAKRQRTGMTNLEYFEELERSGNGFENKERLRPEHEHSGERKRLLEVEVRAGEAAPEGENDALNKDHKPPTGEKILSIQIFTGAAGAEKGHIRVSLAI